MRYVTFSMNERQKLNSRKIHGNGDGEAEEIDVLLINCRFYTINIPHVHVQKCHPSYKSQQSLGCSMVYYLF